jgi:polysaccharide export outer membrane protein
MQFLPTRRSMIHLLLNGAAVPLLGVTSCTSPGSDLPPLADTRSGPYHLAVDDQVRVITFGQEQLTGQFRVNDRGTIAVPLLGAIRASGLTTSDLEREIEKVLKQKKVLLDPSVSVEVLGYRPMFILGEVSKPGQYPYEPGMTVLTAVAIAGGFTYRAQKNYAGLLRTVKGHSVEGRGSRGAEVRPGDVVTVFERYF